MSAHCTARRLVAQCTIHLTTPRRLTDSYTADVLRNAYEKCAASHPYDGGAVRSVHHCLLESPSSENPLESLTKLRESCS